MFIRNRLMVQIGPFGKARCEARCSASGKRRNVAGGPIWTTEGRVFTPADCVTVRLWPHGPRREPCLASRRENPVKLIPYKHEALWAYAPRFRLANVRSRNALRRMKP